MTLEMVTRRERILFTYTVLDFQHSRVGVLRGVSFCRFYFVLMHFARLVTVVRIKMQ
jgi:hypothetical protein